MRFISAIAAFLAGLLLLGLGLGQLTVWAPEDSTTVTSQELEDAPLTVITDDVIDSEAGRDELTIDAEGEYTLALGRTHDVEAWVGETSHVLVNGYEEASGEDQEAQLTAERVEGEETAPNPAGSDLWVVTETVEGEHTYQWNTQGDGGEWSVLVFRDGTEAAPSQISMTITEDNDTTGATVMLVLGGLLLLLALGLLYWALAGARRDREERHEDDETDGTSAEVPAEETTVTGETPAQESEGTPSTETDTERGDSGRSFFAALTAGALALGAAVGVAAPAQAEETAPAEEGAEQSQTDQAEAEQEEAEGEAPQLEQEHSVLLDSQLERILEDIAVTAAEADEAGDAELLEPRIAGHAAQVRELAYRNHELAETSMPQPIGTEVLSAAVTSETEFPREAIVVTEHPETSLRQVLVLEQESARENYRLTHFSLMPSDYDAFPVIATEQGGVKSVELDNEDNGLTPAAALEGLSQFFADSDHDFAERVAPSSYIDDLHGYFTQLEEAMEATELSFPEPQVHEELTALELPDGSVVVAGSFELIMQMAPLADGDTIFLDYDLVEELVGTDWTTFPTEILTLQSAVVRIPADYGDGGQIELVGIHELTMDASIDEPEWFEGYPGPAVRDEDEDEETEDQDESEEQADEDAQDSDEEPEEDTQSEGDEPAEETDADQTPEEDAEA
ncbi:hypothetical protein [Nesterenkonia flava]|uniref:Uncharacterized protein n=1 Tax=Nesterenkonia flava TaxID=469799 RepID=A0ABU1FS15_9MICC|nr:hypothetical protein [Nesterenkonia flava]MDR5711462.1 hypothetical protein [Nesterenkonia flava]